MTLMRFSVRRLALLLWLTSLVLPTLPTPDIGNLPGTPLRGAYLLVKSLAMALYLPQSILYPLHLLSLASNALFLRELLALVPRWRDRFTPASPWLLAGVICINAYVGLRTLRPDGQVPLGGVLSQPGYFVWLGAFVVLWGAAWWSRRGRALDAARDAAQVDDGRGAAAAQDGQAEGGHGGRAGDVQVAHPLELDLGERGGHDGHAQLGRDQVDDR